MPWSLFLAAAQAGELPLPETVPGLGAEVEIRGARAAWETGRWMTLSGLGTATAGGALLLFGGISGECCAPQTIGAIMVVGGTAGAVIGVPVMSGSAARGARVLGEAGGDARAPVAVASVVATSIGFAGVVVIPVGSVATAGYVTPEATLATAAVAVVGIGTGTVLAAGWWHETNSRFAPRISVGPGTLYVSGEF